MKARKVLDDKMVLADGRLIQRLVWRLPATTADRPQGLKYRLYCGKEGRCIVRYDNEPGRVITSIMARTTSALTNLFHWSG